MNSILKTSLHNDIDIARVLKLVKTIEDPRTKSGKHPFESIIVIAVCAFLGGANDAVAIAQFGMNHKDWFTQFLFLPHGIPSHDTFNRIIGMISTHEMQKLLLLEHAENKPSEPMGDEGKESNEQPIAKRQIPIDGKALRALNGLKPTVLLRAFFPSTNRVLGQEKVPSKTNEITTIPKLLQRIKNFIKGCICSIDAIGTQVRIAKLIIALGSSYFMAIKKNQPQLYEDVSLYLNDVARGAMPNAKYTYCETVEKGHGRIEKRQCWTTTTIAWLYRRKRWKNAQSLSIIISTVTRKNTEPTVTKRYYICNEPINAKTALALARKHWSIENNLHWPLNVDFREHVSTTRKRAGAENMAVLRSVALTLLENNSMNVSIKNKRARAACNFDYMLEVLVGKPIDRRSIVQKTCDYLTNIFKRPTQPSPVAAK